MASLRLARPVTASPVFLRRASPSPPSLGFPMRKGSVGPPLRRVSRNRTYRQGDFLAQHRVNTAEQGHGVEEFTSWLENCLDGYGLDAVLYSRCILSILRQPQSSAENERSLFFDFEVFSLELDESRDATRGESLSDESREAALVDILRSVYSDGIDDTKFAKKLALEILERYAAVQEADGRRQPNDSIDSGVCPSPDESFQNYDEAFPPLSTPTACEHEIEVITDRAAFGVADDVGWAWKSATVGPPMQSSPPIVWRDGDATPRKRFRRDSDGGSGEGGSGPVHTAFVRPSVTDDHARRASKIPAALRFLGGDDIPRGLSRPLRSCPDMTLGGRRTASYLLGGLGACATARKAPFTALGHSPQFIVPKCYKVAVAPIPRLPHRPSARCGCVDCERSIPGFDLGASMYTTWMTFNYKGGIGFTPPQPFWSQASASDWLAAASSMSSQTPGPAPSIETCFWNARLSAACTAPTWRRPVPGASAATPDSNSIAGETQFRANSLEEEFNAAVAAAVAQSLHSPPRKSTDELMFDAPQFILQVINEDESPEVPDQPPTSSAFRSKPATQPQAIAQQEVVDLQNSLSDLVSGRPGINVSPASASLARGPGAEFPFVADKARVDRTYDTLQPTSFCLPKLDSALSGSSSNLTVGSLGRTQQTQGLPIPNQGASYLLPNVGSFGGRSGSGSSGPASGSIPSKLTAAIVAASQSGSKLSPFNKTKSLAAVCAATAYENGTAKKPPSAAIDLAADGGLGGGAGAPLRIPISPDTHFIPIRAESMYDAYFPKPQFDEMTESFLEAHSSALEGYHVLESGIAGKAPKPLETRGGDKTDYGDQDTEASSPEKIPDSGPIGGSISSGAARQIDQPLQAPATSSGGGLKLKFRLSKQDKMCQTDDEPPDPADYEAGCYLGHAVLCEYAFKSGLDMNLWSETGTADDSELEKLFLYKDLLLDDELPQAETEISGSRFGNRRLFNRRESGCRGPARGRLETHPPASSYRAPADPNRVIGGLELPPPPPTIGVDDEDIAIWRDGGGRVLNEELREGSSSATNASDLLLEYVGSMTLLSPPMAAAQSGAGQMQESYSRQPWSPAAGGISCRFGPGPKLTPRRSLLDGALDAVHDMEAKSAEYPQTGLPEEDEDFPDFPETAQLFAAMNSTSLYAHGAGLTPPPTPDRNLTDAVPRPPNCWRESACIDSRKDSWPLAAGAKSDDDRGSPSVLLS